jgi:hypothetical protein
MNRRPPLRWPLALVAVTVPLALGACGRVPGQFEILNDQVPSMATGGGCTVAVNPTLYQGDGRLDLAIVRSDADSAYLFFPLIENNLPGATGTQDPNQIQLSGFNVDISAASNAPTAIQSVLAGNPDAHFQTPWSGGISSGGGQLAAIVDAFPVALASALLTMGGIGVGESAPFELHIQAIGTTTTGTEMQSDPFNFPLEVCVGCLVANVEPCPYTVAPANTGNACNPAQDDFVDCCTDNGVLVCPPTVAAKQ